MDRYSPYPMPIGYLHIGDDFIRVYQSIPMDQYLQELYNANPYMANPSYPYIWYSYADQAVIVDMNDLFRHQSGRRPPSFPAVNTYQMPAHQSLYERIDDGFVVNDLDFDQTLNESFEQAEASHVPCSGLTKKLISKKLRVTKYCEEEGEVCVVCQVEFERNERVAMLQCEHRYHPRCITQWLLRKNVCPVCKGQGLSV